jgi:hypothetical protein
MKTVYQVLEEMLGEEQGRLILADLTRSNAVEIRRHIAALTHVLSVLPVGEAGKEV